MSSLPQSKLALKYKVEITKGPHAGQTLTFEKEVVTIGRGPENDIVLSNDGRVSRVHAEIRQNAADYYVLNLSQKNFLYVNGVQVNSQPLHNGALIQVGESEIKFSYDKPLSVVTPKQKNQIHFDVTQDPVVPPAVLPQAIPSVKNQGSVANVGNHSPMQNPGFGSPANLQNNAMGMPGRNPNAFAKPIAADNSKMRFYIIVGVVGLLLAFLLMSNKKGTNKDPNAIRTSEQVLTDLNNTDKTIEQLEKRKKQLNEIQNKKAQENFIKGFRDFQQGQYGRAREAFQITLNLDPENDLAKRYLQLSKIKFDEMVKFHMMQGARYRERKNWRMCQSSFSHVMKMLQGPKEDQTYQEAKKYFDECSLNMEGRF